ncbi:MAG: FHA domain-containing protein [Pyrinomonadaceae bacterium]
MLDVRLTYPTPEGSQEISIEGAKTTFGRGSEAEYRFVDDGLSRLHASVYREGDRVWIVDENSANGTFVNAQPVAAAGTPLHNGDSIKIGNSTILNVRISHQTPQPVVAQTAATSQVGGVAVSDAPAFSLMSILPIALIAFAFLVISITAVVIGYKIFFGGRSEVVYSSEPSDFDDLDKPEKKASPTPKPSGSNSSIKTDDNSALTDSPTSTSTPTASVPSGKQYLSMSDTERRQYLAEKAMRIAQIIGNNSSEAIPDAAIDKIKGFADGYAKRANVTPLGGCRFGDNLQATYERASKNAPFIVKAFNEKGTDPRIGLYLAMIESEHCVCLQSPTGPLGMFQFTYATAKLHFTPSEGVVKGATISNPDDRCKPQPAARAAASYMKALTGRYGTGPSSVPLAIGSYNSGEGGLSSNLVKALESNTGLPRDFWTLISKGEILSKQFQAENFKYVPKFFAAAIIGENPQDFGLKLQPLSTYNK